MGKTRKNNKNAIKTVEKVPLDEQITAGRVVSGKNKVKIRLRAEEDDVSCIQCYFVHLFSSIQFLNNSITQFISVQFVDARSTQKILQAARAQQAEFNLELNGPSLQESIKKAKNAPRFGSRLKDEDLSDDEDRPDITPQEFFDDMQINEDDDRALKLFQNESGTKTRKLADIIMDKIAEKHTEIHTQLSDAGTLKIEDLDPRVKEMYEGVRDVMKKYRSGKVPKAFKIIPKLRNWEQVLYITEPHNWSAAAMFQGTRIFSSVLAQHMAQRFFNLVLLPRIRDDLAEYSRLNAHLYTSLRKALFKPAAFMKGIILPLLEAGDCTLREAIIIGSIIARNQIPVLHSSACLLKICEMEYSGANSIFIRIFLEKRYALPYRVIDAAVFHFIRFEHDKREMPVLWHQSLLTFVQRYKNDISSEQKDALFALLRKQQHPKLTPEIRRELIAARCRDVEMMEPVDNDTPGAVAVDMPDVSLDDDDHDMF